MTGTAPRAIDPAGRRASAVVADVSGAAPVAGMAATHEVH
jgi:hypothetical protein